MRRRALAILMATAGMLSAGRVFAEEDAGVRFRASLYLGGGAYILPKLLTAPLINGQGMAGVRFTRVLALSGGMEINAIWTRLSALHIVFPVVVELTLGDKVSIGAGPELGVFQTGVYEGVLATTRLGLVYGGRLHLAWHAINLEPHRADGMRETLSFGVDLRLRGGGAGFAELSDGSGINPPRALAISPIAFFGYTLF